MTPETYILLHSIEYDEKKLTPILTGFIEDGIPEEHHTSELILGLCLAHDVTAVRNLAKDVVKKRGSKGLKAALKAKSRRNYLNDAGKAEIVADLEELGQIEGFAAHQFARVLSKKLGYSPIRSRRELKARVLSFFYDRATDEEIRDYFLQDGYDPQRGSHTLLGVGNLSDRVARILWEAAEEIQNAVTGILIETPGDGRIPTDPGLFPNLTSLDISAAGLTGLPESLFAQPKLAGLALKDALIARLPDAIGSSPALVTLELKNLKNLDLLPDSLGNLPLLRRLDVGDCPIRELPGSLGTCPNLKEIVIGDCALRRIPEGLGRSSSIKQLHVFFVSAAKVPLEYVHPSVLELPTLSEENKTELRLLMAPSGSYEPVYQGLRMFIESFTDRPIAGRTIQAFQRDGDAVGAHIPELVLAVSRCYRDEEHGPSSNDYYRREIERNAPDSPLKAANAKIARFGFIGRESDDSAVTSLFTALRDVPGFDLSCFAEFVHEMTDHPTAKSFISPK